MKKKVSVGSVGSPLPLGSQDSLLLLFLAWLYHFQLSVAVILQHIPLCLQPRVGGLEKVVDGHLDGPQLPGFLGSLVLDVSPVSVLEGEDIGTMRTCLSKGNASAPEPLACRHKLPYSKLVCHSSFCNPMEGEKIRNLLQSQRLLLDSAMTPWLKDETSVSLDRARLGDLPLPTPQLLTQRGMSL